MNYPKVYQHIMTEIVFQISRLSAGDIEKINDGTHEISLTIKRRGASRSTPRISNATKEEVIDRLNKCKSREDGMVILNNTFKTVKELENFAKSIDVLVLKQDKIEQIKNKIVEATVGAVLRSNAIQGKDD